MKCPRCGKPYTIREMSKMFVVYKRWRAIRWLRRHRWLWEKQEVRGGWRDDVPMTQAFRDIANGLKFAGIYAMSTGIGDMPVRELVAEAASKE